MIWYNGITAGICFIVLTISLYKFIDKEKVTDGIWVLITLNMLTYLLSQ